MAQSSAVTGGTESSGTGSSDKTRKLLIILIIVIVVGGGIVVALFVFLGGDGDSAGAAEVRLEPISSATDPFAPPGQVGQDLSVTPVQTSAPTTVEGGKVGLYGGTMNSSQCDKNQLVTFLQQNPTQGAAWAKVLGRTAAEIPSYVEGLTPTVLRSDTAVTNHGFKNGQATPIQSVLQAGTAVLVDDKGVPVTKCYCGNPLQPPVYYPPTGATTTTYNPTTTTYNPTTTTYYNPTTTTYYYEPPTYYGPKWPEWKDTSITIIQINITVINVFVLTDPMTGQTFNRPRGTDGTFDTPTDAPPETPPTPTPSSNTPRPSSNTPTTTTFSPTTTTFSPTTTTFFEPCVDENNNIVPCP